MKKMQCEVCGSNEIMKVSDGIFECQSCGVRYSTEEAQKLLVEVTAEVKVDHSQEAKNMVKRAKQFEDRGDQEKAKEYYEKALDLDPENEDATDAILQGTQFVPEIIVLEPNVSIFKAEEKLFHYLYNCNKLAPDFFADVEIIEKVEKYYPFTVAHGEISGTFTGTSCYEHKVPYTEYESKTIFMNDGTRRTTKVPVTKYRTEVEKRPASGQFSTAAFGIYSTSPDLNGRITSTKANDIDAIDINSNTFGDESVCGAKMFAGLESLMAEIVRKNNGNFSVLDMNLLTEQGGKKLYKDFEIDMDLGDKSWMNRASKLYADEVDFACRMSAESACPGDYCEHISYVQTTNNSDTMIYYVPVQIIEYAYKGDFYIAIQILHTSCNRIAATYPINKDAAVLQAQSEMQSAELKKFSAPGIAASIIAILGAIVAVIVAFSTDSSTGVLTFFIILLVLVLPLGLIEGSITKKKQKVLDDINEKISEERKSVEGILGNTFKIFVNCFSKTKSVKDASLKARESISTLFDSSKHTINFSEFAKPIIVSMRSNEKPTSKTPGKVFVYIGKRNTIGGAVRITINGTDKGTIKSNEHIAIDIEKDCTIDCKWNQAFTKVSFKAFVGQTKVVYLTYGGLNLIVKEVNGDDRFDDFLRNGEMQTAINCYCTEYKVKEDIAIDALEKRKMHLKI